LKKAGKRLSDLLVRNAETLKDLDQADIRQKECVKKMALADPLVSQGLSYLALDAAGQDPTEIICRRYEETDRDLKQTISVVQSAEKIEKEMAVMRNVLEKTRASLTQSVQDTQAVAHRKASAQQALERITLEASIFSGQLRHLQDETLRALSPYGIDHLSPDLLNIIFKELTDRRDRWQVQQKRKIELEKEIAALTLQAGHRSGEIRKIETDLKEKREALEFLLLAADELSREREHLFGKKNPDTEEKRLAVAIEEAEKQLDDTRKAMNAADQELGTLTNQIAALEKAVEVRSEQLKASEVAFLSRASRTGFSDEADFLTACLGEEERALLTQKAEDLTAAQTGLAARHRDKTAQLEAERQKKMTEKPLEPLRQEAAALLGSLKDLQQALGGIRQKLQDNETLRCKQQDLAGQIDAQKKECSRWEMLHALIGSADGKKYRNFAQGLTFEIMIGYANRRLQQMTDRYLLIRDGAQPLELNVIDNYQAGEIRSTKNLSGGESFIVSLSLALGLSSMAGRNVRVDSLFLDEGFGTLDEEALDMALETLSGLRRDGKLIGVISHVPVLQERIGTRIEIIPQTGGRSILSGPGCRGGA
jgi:exonuclease SbcC